MNKVIVACLLFLTGLSGTALADGPDCAPEAKKLEWYVCVEKAVEYKRGMRTETRDECAINERIDVKGCDLGDVMRFLPEGVDPEYFYVYAIGPIDFDNNLWEIQENNEANQCTIKRGSMEAWKLMKFSDAFDKDNAARSQMVEDALAKKKQKLITDAMLGPHPGSGCEGKKAAIGQVDKKTVSKFSWYAEAHFK
ncbi:MAG: hypothetical protein KC635_29725 [Myxococcales bacterium]|nr:hypothetical protein [Myxococcales bacterium]MCB9735774.1 hypothetical protein [Deltaproteobacteria bacterium]